MGVMMVLRLLDDLVAAVSSIVGAWTIHKRHIIRASRSQGTILKGELHAYDLNQAGEAKRGENGSPNSRRNSQAPPPRVQDGTNTHQRGGQIQFVLATKTPSGMINLMTSLNFALSENTHTRTKTRGNADNGVNFALFDDRSDPGEYFLHAAPREL